MRRFHADELLARAASSQLNQGQNVFVCRIDQCSKGHGSIVEGYSLAAESQYRREKRDTSTALVQSITQGANQKIEQQNRRSQRMIILKQDSTDTISA